MKTITYDPALWQLVPVEPTPEMSAKGFCVEEAEHDPAGVYRAMLAAASQPPAEPLGEQKTKNDRVVELAGEMAKAFELHFGQKWTDPDWRQEASTWAVAWNKAKADKPLKELSDVEPIGCCIADEFGEYIIFRPAAKLLPRGNHLVFTKLEKSIDLSDNEIDEILDAAGVPFFLGRPASSDIAIARAAIKADRDLNGRTK